MAELDAFQKQVGEWAESVFTQATDASIVSHLKREVQELLDVAKLSMVNTGVELNRFDEEAADCFLILLHLAHRLDFSLWDAANCKLIVNRARKWGTPDSEGVVEHVRERRRLDIIAPPDWNEYDAYLLNGGKLEYQEWHAERSGI